MISYDFLIFMDTKTYHVYPFLHQTWLRRRLNHWPEPNLQACHGFSTNLSWCFGHWSTSSVPSRVIPITDPTCAYGRSYIGFAKKILKYGTSKLSCKEIWKPPQLTKPSPMSGPIQGGEPSKFCVCAKTYSPPENRRRRMLPSGKLT